MTVWRVTAKVRKKKVFRNVFLKDENKPIIGIDEETYSANIGNLPGPGDLVWTRDLDGTGKPYEDFYLGEIPDGSKWDDPQDASFRNAGIAKICPCTLTKIYQSHVKKSEVLGSNSTNSIKGFVNAYDGKVLDGEGSDLYEVPENEQLAKDFRKIWEEIQIWKKSRGGKRT